VAGGGELTPVPGWLERRTSQAPRDLRERVLAYAAEAGGASPEALAMAGQRALAAVLCHAGDRRVALDLLAADGLITLALLAQAEQAPERLHIFAASLLDAGSRGGD
jgi:hypothetical protein